MDERLRDDTCGADGEKSRWYSLNGNDGDGDRDLLYSERYDANYFHHCSSPFYSAQKEVSVSTKIST